MPANERAWASFTRPGAAGWGLGMPNGWRRAATLACWPSDPGRQADQAPNPAEIAAVRLAPGRADRHRGYAGGDPMTELAPTGDQHGPAGHRPAVNLFHVGAPWRSPHPIPAPPPADSPCPFPTTPNRPTTSDTALGGRVDGTPAALAGRWRALIRGVVGWVVVASTPQWVLARDRVVRAVVGSDGDDELAASVACFELPDGLGDLGQREGSVDEWRELAGLDELAQGLQVFLARVGGQHPQPLAHEP
jgi:hypothetical protein